MNDSSMQPALRALTEQDFAVVAAVAQRIWREHYSTIISLEQIEYMLRGRFTAENLRRYIGADDRWMDVLWNGETAIGYCSCARTTTPHEMKLEQLYVLPAFHGKGLGRLMLDAVEQRARRAGCTTLILSVNKQNRTIDVYRHTGFTVREEIVLDIGGGFVMDDYIMEKRLG